MTLSVESEPTSPGPGTSYQVLPVLGLPDLRPGDDLAALLTEAVSLQDGDVLVVTSKAVSKVEGRLVTVPAGAQREDVRQAAIAAETVRVVARRGANVIVQTGTGSSWQQLASTPATCGPTRSPCSRWTPTLAQKPCEPGCSS